MVESQHQIVSSEGKSGSQGKFVRGSLNARELTLRSVSSDKLDMVSQCTLVGQSALRSNDHCLGNGRCVGPWRCTERLNKFDTGLNTS